MPLKGTTTKINSKGLFSSSDITKMQNAMYNMAHIIPKSKAYIIRDDTNKRLVFQFNPTSIPYSRGANYASIESAGMSYPLTQYVGGKAREFSFELFYYDKPYTGKIDSARKFLYGLLPPETNKKGYKKPPTFTLAYGYFVRTLVLTDLEINDEWMNSDGKPLMTRFTLSVRQVGK